MALYIFTQQDITIPLLESSSPPIPSYPIRSTRKHSTGMAMQETTHCFISIHEGVMKGSSPFLTTFQQEC